MYIITKLIMILFPLVVFRYFFSNPPAFISPKNIMRTILTGLGTGLIMSVFILLLMKTPLFLILASATPEIKMKIASFGLENVFILFSLVLSVVHSMFEEYYWRWFVFGSLFSRLRLPWAIILASAAFTAHHVVILSQIFSVLWMILGGISVFAAGVIWCLHYHNQHSILGAWISHVLVDLCLMGIIYIVAF